MCSTWNMCPYFRGNCVHAILHLIFATWFTKKLKFDPYKIKKIIQISFKKMSCSLMFQCQDAHMYQISAHYHEIWHGYGVLPRHMGLRLLNLHSRIFGYIGVFWHGKQYCWREFSNYISKCHFPFSKCQNWDILWSKYKEYGAKWH